MWFLNWGDAQKLEGVQAYLLATKGQRVRFEPFNISIPFGSLAVNTRSALFPVDIDCEYLYAWLGTSAAQATVGQGLTPDVQGGYLIRTTFQRGGKVLSQGHRTIAGDNNLEGWIPAGSFAGGVENPYYFDVPIILEPSANVVFQAFNGANANRALTLCLLGFKLFPIDSAEIAA